MLRSLAKCCEVLQIGKFFSGVATVAEMRIRLESKGEENVDEC